MRSFLIASLLTACAGPPVNAVDAKMHGEQLRFEVQTRPGATVELTVEAVDVRKFASADDSGVAHLDTPTDSFEPGQTVSVDVVVTEPQALMGSTTHDARDVRLPEFGTLTWSSCPKGEDHLFYGVNEDRVIKPCLSERGLTLPATVSGEISGEASYVDGHLIFDVTPEIARLPVDSLREDALLAATPDTLTADRTVTLTRGEHTFAKLASLKILPKEALSLVQKQVFAGKPAPGNGSAALVFGLARVRRIGEAKTVADVGYFATVSEVREIPHRECRYNKVAEPLKVVVVEYQVDVRDHTGREIASQRITGKRGPCPGMMSFRPDEKAPSFRVMPQGAAVLDLVRRAMR